VPNSSMKSNLAYVIATVNKQLEDELQERLRPAGIPLEQLRILEALSAQDGRSMTELAALALIEPTTLTKVVDRMVADQLVFRSPDLEDRRRILIVLAPAGRALFRRLNRITLSQQERIAKQIPRGKLGELRTLLRNLVEEERR
jgi:MarR family transcriptional regulator, organic hydroperoxide resistance regulator